MTAVNIKESYLRVFNRPDTVETTNGTKYVKGIFHRKVEVIWPESIRSPWFSTVSSAPTIKLVIRDRLSIGTCSKAQVVHLVMEKVESGDSVFT